jgi:poly(3-hydroxybutyrate) depolymerase
MKAVITDIKQKFHPQGGIHAAAESLGGEFLVKLDSDLPSGTFADNYIVSSTVFQTEGQPRPGIPVKIVRGEQDPILPATGGKMHPNINPITNTLVRWQVEDTDRTDQSCPPCMLQEFLKANDFSGPLPPKIDKGSYFETVYTVNGIHIVLDEVKNAGHYWFGRKKGGCHETLATGVNGINPPESAFDASADMARFFGLRQD